MPRIIKELMARFVLLLYVLPILFLMAPIIRMASIKHIASKGTYIRSIKGDIIMVHMVEDALKEFNNNVEFDIVPKKGDRPIDIVLINDFVWNPFGPDKTLGKAYPRWNNCEINIATSRHSTDQSFKTTVIHEYLHCFGYMHVDKYDDIMYKYNNGGDNISKSIKRYAKELAEILR